MNNIIGIDIGGTSIVGGRIENEVIVKKVSADTEANKGGDTTINILVDIIKQLINTNTSAIGIGVPSVVDREKGIVYNVQNIKGWDEIFLKDIIENKFKIPVYIDNDANCFALGEKIFGKGKDFQHFVGVTLGTGVGGGIIQSNHLMKDANTGSGEFGEVPYLDSILEEYCGSRFFPNKANMSGLEVATKAKDGDIKAIETFDEYGKHVAALVKIIMFIIDPEAIIIGGSISQSFDLFKGSLYKSLQDFPYPNSVRNIKILTSDIKDIGVLGAAALCVDTPHNI